MYHLPLFPLNTVLFPGTPISLHIFEERYKLMMATVLKGDRTFGVIMIRSGLEAQGPLAVPFSIGCTARIVQDETLSDGRMNLVAVGEDRFEILESSHSQPYLVGKVQNVPFERPRSLEIVSSANALRELIHKYLKILTEAQKNSSDLEAEIELDQLDLPEDPTHLVFMAAALLQIPAIEKQQLLEISSVEDLMQSIFRIYKREISVNTSFLQNDEESLRRSTWLN